MKLAVMLAFVSFLVLSIILGSSASVVNNVQTKSTPIFRESNGIYTVKIEVGTPGQELQVALSHLRDAIIVSKTCTQNCNGRTAFDMLVSSSATSSAAVNNLATAYGNFTCTEDITDKTKIAGKTVARATWHLANSADLPSGTTYVGLLPVTGTAGDLSLERLAEQTANKAFAINFARDSEDVGSGRLWMGATDSTIPQDSIVFLDALKFQGFSMIRFTEGQIGETTLGCRLGPKTDCDATLNLASNFSTLGRNLDTLAASLNLTKRSNQYVVTCSAVNNLPNLSLKMNSQRLTFTPQQYVVRNQVQGGEECLFGFVSSSFKDFQLGLNLMQHLYLTYRETDDGGVRKLQYGFYNVDQN